MNTSRPGPRFLGTLAITMLLAGCLSPTDHRLDPEMPTATAAPLPTADAVAAAPDLLANGGLTFPADATDVEVDLITYGEFREVSLTRFTTSPAAAKAVCTDGATEEWAETRTGYEEDMLGAFVFEPGMTGCHVPADPWTIARVFISQDDPARVTVLIYRIPSR